MFCIVAKRMPYPKLSTLEEARGAGVIQRNQAVIQAAQPFLFEGGPTGLLMIHGFGGLPGELRPLGTFLAEQGYTVSGMLLARHGRHPEDMYKVRWQEWFESVETALDELQGRCQHVFVLGYSLGGLLALHLAARRPVAGVITLAAALQLSGGWPLRLLLVARYVMPWFYPMRGANFHDPRLRADLSSKIGTLNFDDPAVIQQLRTSIRIPTGAIYEIVRLAQQVRQELPQITVPALVLQGRHDETVLPISAQRIMAGLGATDKQLRWFDRSGHLLPNDVEQAAVRVTITEWIQKR
jgi:carboxylesterase